MQKREGLSSEILVYWLLIVIVCVVVVIGLNYISSQKNVDKNGAASTAISKDATTVLKSSDGSALIVVPANAATSAEDISIKSVENPVIDSKKRASEIYQFGPAGATFSNPIEIRVKYDPKIVGDCPGLINFHHYNEDGTIKEYVASKTVYCSSHMVFFEIDSFSLGYAGLAVRDEEQGEKVARNLISGYLISSITGHDVAGSCGQGSYFSKLEGFDYNKFTDCNHKTPKYLAARAFSNFETPTLVNSDIIPLLNSKGLKATQVSKDVINFDVEYEPGKKVGRIDVIRDVDDNSGIGKAWQWLPVSDSTQQPVQQAHPQIDCNDPTGTLPQVDSLSPTTASTGTALTINGEFLTHTIQFYGDNGRNSYIGAVNSDCSKSTISVPSDLPSGTYTVKIYKARDKISNGKTITISSGGSGNGINPTFNIQNCQEDMKDLGARDGIFAKDDVAASTQCRDVVWMVRNTNTALACSPDFTYIGIPAATWRGWVENEAKAVLDACALVNHEGNDPPQLIENLRSALEKYWKNCIHRKGISCVCNPNPSDPVCGPFVHFIGKTNDTPSGNIPTSPSNTFTPTAPSSDWSPKLTINGWFPQISPDGRYVTYGFGENWVVDLQTGEERSFTQATGQSFAGQWIKPDTLTFINFISQRDNTADRYEVKVGEWIARKTNDSPALVAGNTFVAADGHWASWIADAQNNNFRITYDNSILATGVGRVAIGEGNWLAYAADNNHSALKVWHNGNVTATYTPQVPLQQWAINRGYVLYGGYGPVHGITPNGQDIDLTVASWRWEGIGGIIFVEDVPWVFTSSWDDAGNKGYVFIRPWGERTGIAVEVEAAGLDVKYANGKFIIAANSDRGQLKVITVSANVTGGGGNISAATPANPVEILPGWQGDLAYNPSNNNWLAVSKDTSGDYDGVITGKIVGNNGAGVTQQFRISQINPIIRGGTPRVAFSSSTNKYLVVWATDADAAASPGQIFGRFVSADGQLSGQPFLITGSLSGINEISGKLRYDSGTNKFILAVNNAGSTTVKLVTIGTDGAIGNFIAVSPPTGHRFSSNIATNPNAGEYCIIYLAQRSDAEFTQVFVKKVDISTGTVGQEYEVSQHTSGHVSAPSIDYDSDSNKYLAVWSRYGGDGTKGRFLTGCTPTGNEINIKQSMNLPSIYYNVNSKLYGIIGEVTENADSLHVNRGEENYYLFVNPSGSIIDGGKIFTDFGPTGNKLPMIAANTQDGTFAAISSKDYGMTRFVSGLGGNLVTTAINNGGNNGNNPAPTTSSSVIATKELGPGTFPDVAFYNGKLWLAVQQEGQLKLYNFDSGLTNQQVTTIPINGGQAFPKLTVHNNILWLAYRKGDSSAGTTESIKLWRSDTQAIEDLGGGFGNDPVAVGNGHVAWQKDGKVVRRLLTGGQIDTIRDQLPTGISRILSDGTVKLIDDDRATIPGYYSPGWAADLTVAEDNDNGIIYFFNNDINSLSRLWQGLTTFAPKAAADGNGNYAVAAWSPASSRGTTRVAVIKKA